MIQGIGIDCVEVVRFKEWSTYQSEKLLKVFSKAELVELTRDGGIPEQFFASRFAAKEAFYKALSAALVFTGLTHKEFSFQFARSHVEIVKETWGVPVLKVDWSAFEATLGRKLPSFKTHVSLSHERSVATAMVVISL